MSTTLLKVNASGRLETSLSRELSARLADGMNSAGKVDRVIDRDLLAGIGLISPEWVAANFTPAEQRTAAQHEVLAESDALVDELVASDVVVIAAPIYNFAAPAKLKAWIDQVCRSGRTFRYSENGPVGLLEGKKAYVIVTSGGTEIDSPIDFMTPYLRHVLGFIGIHDVTVIAADRTMMRGDEAPTAARQEIDDLLAAA